MVNLTQDVRLDETECLLITNAIDSLVEIPERTACVGPIVLRGEIVSSINVEFVISLQGDRL